MYSEDKKKTPIKTGNVPEKHEIQVAQMIDQDKCTDTEIQLYLRTAHLCD